MNEVAPTYSSKKRAQFQQCNRASVFRADKNEVRIVRLLAGINASGEWFLTDRS
jgi:hypothetical protein